MQMKTLFSLKNSARMGINMYTFICEDSPNGIFSGIYDAWDFKVNQNKKYPAGSTATDTSSRIYPHACSHEDIHLVCHEPDNYQLFYEYIHVETSTEKSDKVARTIQCRLGSEFYDAILNAILSIVPTKKNDLDKADAIYHTLVLGLNTTAGARAIHDLSNPYVHRLFTLSRATANEAHHLLGFLRFSELENGVLFSTIHPKNNALPILAEHFTDRLPQENFMIYDENRQLAAVHAAGKNFMLVDTSGIDQDLLKRTSEKESAYRKLWLAFFDQIAIQARINPKLQAQNIPKRFWSDTPELAKK
jgi:probable DNA metabolism protein